MNRSSDISRPSGEAFHRRYRNLFVGVFILIVVVILAILFLFTVFRDRLEKWDHLFVKYDTASGLASNGAVTILGMKVGSIEKVSLNPAGHIEVKLKIKRMYTPYIHRDSRARLQQKNVAIGDWEIDLTRGSPDSPSVKSGDTLLSEVQAPLAKTLDQVTKTVEVLQKILQDISEGKGTVGRLIKEDTLLVLAHSTARNANGLILRAYTTLARLDTILAKVAQIGEKGKDIADSVKTIASKVGTLVSDVNLLVKSVHSMSQDLPSVMTRVQADITEVELLLKALQSNFIIKSGINSQADPLMNDNPSR
ncbi:MAG TPA: MlaD family protein [Chitinivibrionales bacterium]|nr:MlaD family protein [Chitinivibrionales bacterium]